MKKFVVLITTILFSLIVGFSGCYSSYTLTDVVTSPTQIFEYDGSVEESYSEVKKELFRNNLTFAYEDRLSAILVTDIKKLFASEYYNNLNLFFENIPESVSIDQEGSLFFLFTDLGSNKTKIELYTKIFVQI